MTLLDTDEREHLRASARSLLERESPMARVRSVTSEPPGYDPGLWGQMVDLGWTTIHVPVERGGAGFGHADVAIIVRELGRALTPSPFLASALLASGALVLADNHELGTDLISSLASGEALGTVALASVDGSCDRTRLTVGWQGRGGSVQLTGTSGFVLDADLAGSLVVAARDEQGTMAVFAVDSSTPGVRIERTPMVDHTRRLFEVSFEDVTVTADRALCEPGPRAVELLDRVLSIGAVAAACDAVGVAERVLEETTGYAKERIQFGKPIGSFQAVKHHCADMAISVESSRAAVDGAMRALDGEASDWTSTAAIAMSHVGPACVEACALGLLVHGGIGFTWEHDSHLFLKRAKLDEVLFGTPSWHRRRLAACAFPSLIGRGS